MNHYAVNRSGQQTGRGENRCGALASPITGAMWELVALVWGEDAEDRASRIADVLDNQARKSVGHRPDASCDAYSSGTVDLIRYYPSQQISEWGYDLGDVADKLLVLARSNRLYPPKSVCLTRQDREKYCRQFDRADAMAMARQLIRASRTHITQLADA